MDKKQHKYNCDNCGIEIVGAKAKSILYGLGRGREHGFCSRKCLGVFTTAKALESAVCEFCKKEFTNRASLKSRFCTVECYRKYQTSHPELYAEYGRKSHKLRAKYWKDGVICLFCNKTFNTLISQDKKFCNQECANNYKRLHKELYVQSGKDNISKQSRRSKNEIYFYELCKERFNEVLSNERMFDGWDADVIIKDLKIAVLWNGIWHYKKMFETHAIKQVQNRDRIKIDKILDAGYAPYIIKDMGSFSKKFVEKQFEILLKNLNLEREKA